jgi:hypothetical protein
MKTLLAALLAAAAALAAVPAGADDTVKVAPGTIVLPWRTIYGRPDKPMVVIEIKPLSAAAAAGAAHESLRTTLVNQSQPAPLGR